MKEGSPLSVLWIHACIPKSISKDTVDSFPIFSAASLLHSANTTVCATAIRGLPWIYYGCIWFTFKWFTFEQTQIDTCILAAFIPTRAYKLWNRQMKTIPTWEHARKYIQINRETSFSNKPKCQRQFPVGKRNSTVLGLVVNFLVWQFWWTLYIYIICIHTLCSFIDNKQYFLMLPKMNGISHPVKQEPPFSSF